MCIARFYSEKGAGVTWVLQSSSWVSKRWVTHWRSPGWEGALLDGKRRISPSRCWSPAPARTTPLVAQRFFWNLKAATSVRPLLIASPPTLSSTMPYNYAILCMQGEKCPLTQEAGWAAGDSQGEWPFCTWWKATGGKSEIYLLMKDKRPVTIGNQLSSKFLPF